MRAHHTFIYISCTYVIYKCLCGGAGEITNRMNALRDPAIFVDADPEAEGGGQRVYLFYCGAGENCIGVAELIFSGGDGGGAKL